MTVTIITLCVLILIAYAFDLSSKRTRIPTVLLLLILGWAVHQATDFFKLRVPDLNPILPLFGTVGLILIVLEGGLELELNKSKKKILAKSALSGLIPAVILFLIIGAGFSYYSGQSLVDGIINAIPLCIISSSVAIPTAKNLEKNEREFVIYESSWSDIFGVIIFNFFTANEVINLMAVGNFFLQMLIMFVVSLIASIGLAFLIKKIDHHVKFIPIITIAILIYVISYVYDLPALIFILIFGLLLNNLEEFKNISFIKKLNPEKLDSEVHRFREVVGEITFLIRTLFFLLFGFVINARTLLDPTSLIIAGSIIAAILIVRIIHLKIAGMPMSPLLFIAPRGLITVLLFLSIPISRQIHFVNEVVLMQIILMSAIIMMIGFMFKKEKVEEKENEDENNYIPGG
jgi:hypothetical protein